MAWNRPLRPAPAKADPAPARAPGDRARPRAVPDKPGVSTFRCPRAGESGVGSDAGPILHWRRPRSGARAGFPSVFQMPGSRANRFRAVHLYRWAGGTVRYCRAPGREGARHAVPGILSIKDESSESRGEPQAGGLCGGGGWAICPSGFNDRKCIARFANPHRPFRRRPADAGRIIERPPRREQRPSCHRCRACRPCGRGSAPLHAIGG